MPEAAVAAGLIAKGNTMRKERMLELLRKLQHDDDEEAADHSCAFCGYDVQHGPGPDDCDLAQAIAHLALDIAGKLRACVICGCTDLEACPQGCSWFTRPGDRIQICSACVVKAVENASGKVRPNVRRSIAHVARKADPKTAKRVRR